MTSAFALLMVDLIPVILPVNPWAAVVDHALVALIYTAVPTIAVLVRGHISHREHVATGGKLEELAEHAAVVVTQQAVVAQQLTAQINENTALTVQAAEASKEAASVANDVNKKIAETLSAVNVQQAQEQHRQDTARDRRVGDKEK